MKKKKKRRRNKGRKVSLPNDVAPITHCDDDNCYTIGAIHTINDESDCAYDTKRPKLGEAMINEDDIFSLPSFDMQVYNDDSMPPTYDDYCDDTYAIKISDYIYKTCHDYGYPFSEHYSFNVETIYSIQVSYDTPTIPIKKNFAHVESNKISMLVDHEKNALCDGYIVEFIHEATKNYYEGGIYACRNCNNIKFPLYVLKVLKLCLFCLPMLVDYCSHKLFAHKIPMHRK